MEAELRDSGRVRQAGPIVFDMKAFLLRIVDHDNQRYWVEGPMTNDSALNEAVVRAQRFGRRVTCSSVESTDKTDPNLR